VLGASTIALRVSPGGHFVNHQQDPYGNWLARFIFSEPVRELKIEVDLVADMSVYNPFDFFLEEAAEKFPFQYSAELAQELAPYLSPEPATPLVELYLEKVDRTERRTIDFLVAINQQVARDIRYLIRMEHGVQTPELTLQNASGSCRDSAWLLVQMLRHLGIAARFVSGYRIDVLGDPDDPATLVGNELELHAWVEAFVPGAGWIALDPTTGLLCGGGYIPLAATHVDEHRSRSLHLA